MRLLCLDVRNSRTTFGVFADETLVDTWHVSTDVRRTADEWGLLVTGLLADEAARLDGVCVSSTVPAALHDVRAMLAAYFEGVATLVVAPGVKSGLAVLVDNPREVGTDRVANAVAAAQLVGGPCIVVDFETATTFDVVDAQGRFVGGAIAPGVEASMSALRDQAAQLRQVEVDRPRSVVAKNTIEALQSGAVYGFAGLVDGLASRIAGELGADASELSVIATGNLDSVVVDECACVTRREPYLTLLGLRIIYSRNRP
ncbi:MAG: type III pantothenate kinase [Propionibacteriales bacterium]|nr:type III pantothenate kinase [Propionibacteriales bacterium]